MLVCSDDEEAAEEESERSVSRGLVRAERAFVPAPRLVSSHSQAMPTLVPSRQAAAR